MGNSTGNRGKMTEVSFVFLGSNSKSSIVHRSIMLTTIVTSKRLLLAGVPLGFRGNIFMGFSVMGEWSADHECLGRESSGTFPMTPFWAGSQVQPLWPHAHILPAILALEGRPEEPSVLRQMARVGPCRNDKVRGSNTLASQVPDLNPHVSCLAFFCLYIGNLWGSYYGVSLYLYYSKRKSNVLEINCMHI